MKVEELRNMFAKAYGPFFTYDEFLCKCNTCETRSKGGFDTGEWFETPEFSSFMSELIDLRIDVAFPFVINSGHRCPLYNDSLYGAEGTHLEGPHTKGAADIKVMFERAYALTRAAMARGMGVGPSQRGRPGDRFVHVDAQGPRLWTY